MRACNTQIGKTEFSSKHDGKIKQDDSGIEETAENMTAFSRYMKDAIFLIPTPQVLEKIVTGLEDLYMNDLEGLDMQG